MHISYFFSSSGLSDTEESHEFIPKDTSRVAYVDRLELEAQMKAQADLRAKDRSESIEEERRLTALVVPVERVRADFG